MQLAFPRRATPLLSVAATLLFVACSDAVAPDSSSVNAGGANAAGRKKQPAPSPTPTPTPAPTPPPPDLSNPLIGMALYVNPASKSATQAATWRTTRPADALQMDKIAAQSVAKWFGNWNTDVRADVDRAVAAAAAVYSVPVLVAYNIPQRDCGGFSAGGSNTPDGYRAWISAFATGIGARQAIVILEPDALAGMDCLSSTDQATRTSLLSYAVNTLRALGGTAVYIDAGHSHWHSATTMATRLNNAGIATANGFSLNVSNFYYTSEQVTYGDAISALVGGRHYIVDTSRNGLGSAGDAAWCNPDGRALGERPTASTGHALADAFLWVKVAGESDGACNGNPAAGTWMPEYALGLAQRAAY